MAGAFFNFWGLDSQRRPNKVNIYFNVNGLEATMLLVFDGYLAWPIAHRYIA